MVFFFFFLRGFWVLFCFVFHTTMVESSTVIPLAVDSCGKGCQHKGSHIIADRKKDLGFACNEGEGGSVVVSSAVIPTYILTPTQMRVHITPGQSLSPWGGSLNTIHCQDNQELKRKIYVEYRQRLSRQDPLTPSYLCSKDHMKCFHKEKAKQLWRKHTEVLFLEKCVNGKNYGKNYANKVYRNEWCLSNTKP